MTVPVTVVTGFLGSGKTTLVNRLLREPHGERIAVIENEYGEVGVDAELLARSGTETIVQLANGCLCCTVRGDLAQALQQIAEQAQADGRPIDRVLIETTGLADPGPVIQTFLAETAIEACFHLDGVVALVDAVHAGDQGERLEFRAQLGFADRVLVSKADRASADQREGLESTLAALNPRAPVVSCDLHRVNIGVLLAHVFEARGFALDHVPAEETRRALAGLDLLRRSPQPARLRPLGLAQHTADVRSCVFVADEPLDLAALNATLDELVQVYGPRLWRCKGLLQAEGYRSRLVLQGVQGLIQIGGGTLWRPFEARRSVLVFIGQQIDPAFITERLDRCVVRVAAG